MSAGAAFARGAGAAAAGSSTRNEVEPGNARCRGSGIAASIAEGPRRRVVLGGGTGGGMDGERLRARDDQRGGSVLAGLRQEGGAGREVGGDRGAEAWAEGRGEGELVARGGRQGVRERGGAARGAGVAAQELVDLGELGADAGGLAAGAFRRRRRARGGPCGRTRRRPRRPCGGAAAVGGFGGLLGEDRGGGLAAGLELGEFALQADAVVLGELGQLLLERRDALLGAVVARVLGGLGLERA